MSATLLGFPSATLLCEVLVRVPSASHRMLEAVCKKIQGQLRSIAFQNKRIALGWGPDVITSELKSTKELLKRVQQWAITPPDTRGVENMWLYTDQVHEFNDCGRKGENRVIQSAQWRVGGPQVPPGSLYEQQSFRNNFGHIMLHPFWTSDPKRASSKLRDLWWITVRSLVDGTPLPKSMHIISFNQVEDFEYGATWDFDTDRSNVKLVALVRAGSEYALVATCKAHVRFRVQWNIQAWVGVPAEWAKSTFMRLCLDLALTRLQSYSDSVDLLEVNGPSACTWSDAWTYDVDRDPEYRDMYSESESDTNDRDDDSDIDSKTRKKVSHKVSAWPFNEPLVIKVDEAFHKGPGVRFLPGAPGVHILSNEPYPPETVMSAPQGVPQSAETNYDELIDSNIPHNGEAPVSSEEAFARTAERHIWADRLGVPATQLSVDWPQSAHTEVNASTGIQMTEMQASLEASIIEDSPEEIHCLEFSRTPQSFHEALDTSAILMSCHNDMKAKDLDCKLASGARLYLLPEQHAGALRTISDMNLQSRHVIASARFVEAVSQAVAAIKGREQIREKKRQRVHFEQEEDSDLEVEVPVLIKNSFIYIPVPTSLLSMSTSGPATASTTDADARKGRNPR